MSLKVSLIVPAFNEEKRLRKTIEEFHSFMSCYFLDFEIIIVCNNCSDNTLLIGHKLKKKLGKIVVLNFYFYTGKGGAIIEGFKKARFDLVGFVDADNSTNCFEFLKLVLEIYDVDAVIGSRNLIDSRIIVKQNFFRKFIGRLFSFIINFLFDLKISDTQCGAKVFRKNVIDSVICEMILNGFEFDVELLWRLKRKGFVVKEVPVVWSNSDKSSVGVIDPFKMLYHLVLFRLKGV